MEPTHCLNCLTVVEPGQKFCTNCGQNTDTHRLNFRHIWHDIMHAFTHADKGILFLIKQLAINPGVVAREYVDGKRNKYFNPFSFLILVVGIASVILINSGFVSFNTNSKMPPNPVSVFFNKHVNLIILFNVPVLAFFSWLLFRKSKTNYAENLVLAAYTSGERSVFFSLLVAPLWMLLHNYYYLILGVYIFCWMSYYSWACSTFFPGKKWVSFAKGFLVAVFTQMMTIILVSGSIWIYFMFFYKK